MEERLYMHLEVPLPKSEDIACLKNMNLIKSQFRTGENSVI